MANTITLTKPKIIAVEGKDDANFFIALIRHMGLDSIQVVEMGGKDPPKDKIRAIKAIPGFSSVTSLGLALDADDDCGATFDSVCGGLRASGLGVPTAQLQQTTDNPKITVFLLPACDTNGMLEDLCLSSVQTDNAMPCITAMFDCLTTNGITQQNISKAKAHAFLSTRYQPDKRLGEAALSGYWPFDDHVFDEIKTFVSML